MTKEKEDFKKAMGEVIEGLCNSMEQERAEKQPYKDLFKAHKKGDLTGLLRELEHQMNLIVLDGVSVLKKRTGKEITNKQFEFLQCLPFAEGFISEKIESKEGSMCCVDKAYHVLEKIFHGEYEEKK